MKTAVVLGKGGFGEVVEEGKSARKQLDRDRYVIREAFMLKYMNASKFIVNIEKVNIVNKSILIEKWDMSLSTFIRNYHPNEKQKMKILHDVLCGLSHMHSIGLVHADVTSNNILIKTKNFRACICDLGLTSIREYSKVEGTAPGYAPMVPVKSYGHDMFGLTISMLELFAGFKAIKKFTQLKLRDIISTNKDIPKKVANVMKRMCPDDLTTAITADECLQYLFGEETIFEVPKILKYPSLIKKEYDDYLKNEILTLSKEYKINRGMRAYICLIQFLSSPDGFSEERYPIDPKYYLLYAISALFIYMSLFGNTKLDIEMCLSITNNQYSKDDFYFAINKLFMSENFCAMTLASVR